MESEKEEIRKPNPRQNANIFSALTFWWILPTFYKGFKRDLEISDLFDPLTEHKSDKMGDKLENAWKKEIILAEKLKRDPSLLRVIFRIFGSSLALCGCVLSVIELVIKMVQPIVLGNLLAYYSKDAKDRNVNDVYINAAILIISNLIAVVTFNPYHMGVLHLALKLNVSLCSLMYRKSLRLSQAALEETKVGQIVNLMSNDVNRMYGAVQMIHFLWVGPLVCIFITAIMYREIGYAAVFGVLFVFLHIPFQSWLGHQSSVLRLRTALETDERLKLMNEIINGIKVIKMYTWEKPFANLVALARRKEVKRIRTTLNIQAVNFAFAMCSPRTAVFITILAHVLINKNICATQVFVVAACFHILRNTMIDFFPYAISYVAEAYTSITRIQKFLLVQEREAVQIQINEKYAPKSEEQNSVTESVPNIGISINNVTAKWNNQIQENTLINITATIVPGKLMAVIGPVGSGKTSLLHAILKELPVTDGSIEVNGTVSYASQDPWIFSGSIRQNILFGEQMDKSRYQNVIKCCALQTDFTLLPFGDQTIVGERGILLSGGQRARISLARAVYKQADIYLLDDPLSAVDTNVGQQLFDNCINGFLRGKTVLLVTHQLQYLRGDDQIIILNKGIKEAEGSYNQLRDSGLDFARLLDEQTKSVEDHQESRSGRRISIKSLASHDESNTNPEETEEVCCKGSVSRNVYKSYLKAVGKGWAIFVGVFFILSQIFGSTADYFVSYWVNLEEYRIESKKILDTNETNSNNFWNFSREECIYVYSGLILSLLIITLARSVIFCEACVKASIALHYNMFSSITRATMRFFYTNQSGRILNRFSKDIGSIDNLLPSALMNVLQVGLTIVGSIILTILVNPWLLIPTGIMISVFYLLLIIFLSTSRSVRRLESITSSPVFGHLAESLKGLTTIRAFKTQHILHKEFDKHQDLHSTAMYLFFAGSRTLALWLDMFCVVYLSLVIFSFFIFGTDNYSGNVGLAITQAMALIGMIQWGVRQMSELENIMTSVERVDEYTKIEKEKSLESENDRKPPEDWPAYGQIEFKNLYLTYVPTDPPVLSNLSFKVSPKAKIGIVGRTGAGKSSLIAAIFQLTHTKGSILIDDIDIKDLSLHDTRSKISIIPQEPVLFSGTLRKNLDPFVEYTDEILWRALEEVELKQTVSDLPGHLNSKMLEGGTNFSVGQRQLVCLARAIVRNNRILVLDEATANVDPQTDTLIQKTIRSKFADCTVLTIAHRLHTVMDSDKILVMDAGKMVEFYHPHILMGNSNGYLYKMVEQTGATMAQNLKNVAEQSYRKHIGDLYMKANY